MSAWPAWPPRWPCPDDLLEAVLLRDGLLSQRAVPQAGYKAHALNVVTGEGHLLRPAQVLLVLHLRQEIDEVPRALLQL